MVVSDFVMFSELLFWSLKKHLWIDEHDNDALCSSCKTWVFFIWARPGCSLYV